MGTASTHFLFIERNMPYILKTTGITAAAGMGPNLYLAKIAMDIVAKHVHPDKDGVRIANGYRALCVFRERFIHRTGAHERKMAAAPAGRHNAPPPSADHAAYGAAKTVAEGDFS